MKGDSRKERKANARRKEMNERKEKKLMNFCVKNDHFFSDADTAKLLFVRSTRRLYQILGNTKLIGRKNYRKLKAA